MIMMSALCAYECVSCIIDTLVAKWADGHFTSLYITLPHSPWGMDNQANPYRPSEFFAVAATK